MTETCVIERGRERCRRNTCIWLALRAKKGREHVLVSVEPTCGSGTHKFKYGTIPQSGYVIRNQPCLQPSAFICFPSIESSE